MTDTRLFDMALLLILAVLLVLMGRWLVKWGRETAEKQYRADDGTVPSHLPETALAPLDDTPDGPVPFGYKMGWLAAKCGDPHRLMEVLGLRDPKPANWTTGLAHAGYQGRVFVSPPLDGYVLAVGLWAEDLEDVPGRTERLVDSFPEVQLFGSHRISDYHYWTKYVDGKVVRGYICQDAGAVRDEGNLTPEKLALGFERFPGADRESGWFPGEEDVLDIAAAWGVDPRFQKKVYPPSVGWVCD